MKQQTTRWPVIALFTLALTAAACSDDSGPGTGNGGDTSDDGGGGDMGGDTGNGDTGGGDMLADTGGGDGANDVVDEEVVVDCEVELGSQTLADTYDDGDGGDRDVRIAIVGLDFVNEIVYVENVSDAAIEFDENWSLAYNAATRDSLEDAVDLPAGGLLRIHYDGDGTNTATDFFTLNRDNDFDNLTTCGGEIVIQDRTIHANETLEFSNQPGNIEAFVRWGNRTSLGASATFTDEASDAGAWVGDWTSPVAEVATQTCWNDAESASWCAGLTSACDEDNDEALIPTGDINDPAGWEATEAPQLGACL